MLPLFARSNKIIFLRKNGAMNLLAIGGCFYDHFCHCGRLRKEYHMAALYLCYFCIGPFVHVTLDLRGYAFVFRSYYAIAGFIFPGSLGKRGQETFCMKCTLGSIHEFSVCLGDICTKTGMVLCFIVVNNAFIVRRKHA